MKWFLLLFYLTQAHAQVPLEWLHGKKIKNKNHEVETNRALEQRFDQIVTVHDEALRDQRVNALGPHYQLKRFDVALGVNIGGDIGVMSLGHESTMELIWERPKAQPSTHEIEVVARDASEVKRQVKDHVLAFLSKYHLSKRKKRRILKRIDEKTFESNKLVKAMRTMPQVGEWQASGFFQEFFFSIEGDLLETLSVGVDTRLRFRYKIVGTPLRHQLPEEMNRIQKSLYQFMDHLGDASDKKSSGSRNFVLSEARVSAEFNLGIDLVLLSGSLGRGYTLEFKRVDFAPDLETADEVVLDVKRELIAADRLDRGIEIAENLVARVDQDRPDADHGLRLSRISTKFGFDAEVGIFLVSLEKSSVLDLRYHRREL